MATKPTSTTNQAASPRRAAAKIRDTEHSVGDKAVFLALHFGRYGNRRKVAGSKVEVEAEKRMLTVTKRLLESEELDDIDKHDRITDRWVKDHCLPFDDAMHILPLESVEQMEDYLQQRASERLPLVDRFVRAYPELIRKASDPLGVLYELRDYDSPQDVRLTFRMRWQYVGFSTPGKLAEINPALFRAERDKIRQRMQETFSNIDDLLCFTFKELVGRLRESVEPGPDGKAKRLTDSSVEKLKRFLDTLPARNSIVNNGQLSALGEEVRALMAGIGKDQIRESDQLRSQIAEQLATAASRLDTMTAGRRKFRFDSDEAA